jgi:hypothetical protein
MNSWVIKKTAGPSVSGGGQKSDSLCHKVIKPAERLTERLLEFLYGGVCVGAV